MAKPGAFATKLALAKSVMKREERRAVVYRCIDTLSQSAVIALNREYGFGQERAIRFLEELQRVVEEYGVLADGADVDYADDKLKEAYNRIMGGKT